MKESTSAGANAGAGALTTSGAGMAAPGNRRMTVIDSLRLLVELESVVELRAIGVDGRIASGYFDDLEALANAVEPMDASGDYRGVYLTLNPVDPALLARRANRVQGRLGRGDATTADGDVLRRRWLPVDIDPVRPSGISSTDAEHEVSFRTAEAVREYLASLGWPAPVVADSGNGAHLLYRIELPNDDASTALVKGVLAALDARFSNEGAKVDTANHNAARIWKCYGTVSRKGDSVRDRPHRRSAVVSCPEVFGVVPADRLRALAGDLPPAPAAGPLDLRAWLAGHGIGVASDKPWQGGTLFTLAECPFSDAHTDGAYAVQFANGAVHAGCKHDSCGGGRQRWPELRNRFESERAERVSPPAPEPVSEPDEDPAVTAEAREVLAAGDPLAYMVAAFNLDHVGDPVLGQCLALSLASQIVWNSRGLHAITTGESGKGKSDGYRAMLRQVPERFKLNGSFSDKALYYKQDLSPSSVFFVDDKDMSDAIQEVLKEATSSFSEPITHHTLTTDRKPLTCTIPARCVWWVAKKEGTGDDQVLNRMLTVWVNESKEQDRAVIGSAIDREARDDDRPPGAHREVRVCGAMWELLHGQLIDVNLSRFVRRIRFSDVRNRRNPLMFLDMIKSVAALRFLQRDRRDLAGGVVRVYATEADFETAAGIFAALHGAAGSQAEKLTKRESEVLDLIAAAGLEEFTILKIQALTNLSYHQISRMMSGYRSRGANYTGLLEKCPAVSTLDTSISTQDDAGDGTIRRRAISYTFNAQVYRDWRTGGLVWLAEPDPKDGGPDGGRSLHVQHVRSTFAAGAANHEDTETGQVDETGSISSRVLDHRSSFAADGENTRCSRTVSEAGGVSVFSALCGKEIADLDENAGIWHPGAQKAPLACSSLQQPAANVQQSTPSPADGTAFTLAGVDPADYAPIPDGVGLEECPLCGGRAVHYVEKYRARRARDPGAPGRRICRRCYDAARRREQSAVRVLPGVLPLGELAPVEPGRLGRCDVCGLESATYLHAGSSTAICPHCYELLFRDQVEIR